MLPCPGLHFPGLSWSTTKLIYVITVHVKQVDRIIVVLKEGCRTKIIFLGLSRFCSKIQIKIRPQNFSVLNLYLQENDGESA